MNIQRGQPSEKMSDKASGALKSPITMDDEIVISGLAGRFPESDNVNELRDNLMGERDMITEDERRWKLDHPSLPKRMGKISNIDKFDSIFFGIHSKQADAMDAMSRMLLEHAYEAIVDAGVNPKELRGTKTGVFIGTTFSESEKEWCSHEQDAGVSLIGGFRAMYANRISFWLGAVGPSLALDTACSSSSTAFEEAYRAIKDGTCDAAIVGSSHLGLNPYVTMQLFNLGVLSPDGRSKVWDESANGYVRSEAICVAFLQKAKDAKRIYATIAHCKTNCDGHKKEGVGYPSRHMQSVLLKDVFTECGVSPSSLGYFEAHGTGTKVGDAEEIAAIDTVLGQTRSKDTPLLIGSVKSNLGHTEPVSGLASIVKVVLAMETGIIPPNLHFKTCKGELEAILEGRLKVVSELTPWQGEYAGVNSFGIGGTNANVLLKINTKEKINNGVPCDDLPRLVIVSGRTEEAVEYMLKDLQSKPVDVEQLALLYSIHSQDINGHLYRGYAILPSHGTNDTPVSEVKSVSGVQRPVWFIFSGVGSQWPTMGESLLKLPIFAEVIKKCDSVLKPHGIDIYRILTVNDQSIPDDVMNCFIGITAVQIGLVDVLNSLGIQPDYIVGHSAGELACAYADDCLTAEQTILAAYYRGMACKQGVLVLGSMAAVGLGHREAQELCPADIEVACHNSSTSSTVSGPAESIKNFVAELKAKDIFAKEVNSSGMPFHSSYLRAIVPKLSTKLKKIIPNPKLRSARWLSTSVKMDQWIDEFARYSSPEYYINNILSPVLFEETLNLMSNDAVAIEIAPHSLLQAILKKSLPTTVTYISLMQRYNQDNLEVLLKAIGKIFNEGLNPRIDKLYPTIEFPVSRGTPMISPMIKWEHKDNWFVSYFKNEQKNGSGERTIKINPTSPIYKALSGHVVDGRSVLPASSYLILIWETFGTMKGKPYTEVPVVFENVKFLESIKLIEDGEVELTLMIQKGTGRFEIVQSDKAVATGVIRSPHHSEVKGMNRVANQNENDGDEYITSSDVYKEFRLRGYQYAGNFRSISRATENGSRAHITWHDDWIAFIDNMLQTTILGIDARQSFVPTSATKIMIDPNVHYTQIRSPELAQEIVTFYDKFHNIVSSGGVQIFGLQFCSVPRKKFVEESLIEEYKFFPIFDEAEMSLCDLARLTMNFVTENYTGNNVKTVELLNGTSLTVKNLLSPWIRESLQDIPFVHEADITICCEEEILGVDTLADSISIVNIDQATKDANALLVVSHRFLASEKADQLESVIHLLRPGGFILTRESEILDFEGAAATKGFHVILKKRSGNEIFVLLRGKEEKPREIKIINVRNDNFDWVESMRKLMSEQLDKKTNTRIVFVGQTGFDNGLSGFIKSLRREPGGEMVRGILIQDPTAPAFSCENTFYSQQLEKDLAISVLRENKVWGIYCLSLLSPLQSRLVDHFFLKQTIARDLSSFTWTEGPLRFAFSNENMIQIAYASINARDTMLAAGQLSLSSDAVGSKRVQEAALGLEYSGISSTGKRVMGMIKGGALANICSSDPGITWEIPDDWSLEDAATVPYVYSICCRALYLNGYMKKGDKILIHAGTGGIGQAAINLALAEGCEVFTTVGTPQKRQFIRDTFPQIRDDHIGNSRDTSFEHMIREQTNGCGVDIVLNSLPEETLLASVNCLTLGGHFLEIGKPSVMVNSSLNMECFSRDISVHCITLDRLFITSEQEKLETKLLLDKYVQSGAIKPLVRKVFLKDNVEAAFRYMAAGQHMGKVVIKIEEDYSKTYKQLAAPQYYCFENRSYIILGGLGGFGLELCDWLVLRGAKNLVITSRTGLKSGYQKMRVNLWKSYGVNVTIVSGKDASVYEDCQFIVETAAKLAPVDGVFNLAVVLRDALWDSQTSESFEESFRPKAWTTKHLDTITRKMCPNLRHFVTFSSVASRIGNVGQTNYTMANSVMERICEKRAAEGLPALAIQWGSIGDVGLIGDKEGNKERVFGGTIQQSIDSCLIKFNDFLLQNRPIVSSIIVAKRKAAGSVTILNSILNIMFIQDLKGINVHSTFSELGMDSMMCTEIKQTFERDFDISLSVQDIRNVTFAKVQEMTNTKKTNPKSENDGRSA